MRFKQSFVFITLFSLGAILFYRQLLNNGFGVFNLLTYGYSGQINNRASELIANDVISARFKSKEKNLGLISVRFHNGNRDSKDTIVFRVKKAEESNWYYQAEYKTDQFQPGSLFPFGFPIMTDSKGRDIQFEIKSLHGATGSGIYIDSHNPIFIGSSFFSKEEVLSSPQSVFSFLIRKIINIIEDKQARLNAISYFLPLITYGIYIFLNGASFHFPIIVTLCLISSQVTTFSKDNFIVYLSIVFLWLLTVQKFNFESRISGLAAFIFLLITPILNTFKLQEPAEKTAIWAIIFTFVSAVQSLVETISTKKKIQLESLIDRWKDIDYDKSQKRYLILIKLYRPIVLALSVLVSYKTILDIVHSINVYRSFFGAEIYISKIVPYLFALAMTFAVFTSVLLYLEAKIKNKPIVILLSLVIMRMAISVLSANYTFFQYTPKIILLSPSETSEAWVDITIRGKNFQDKPFTGKLYLGGVEQVENIILWSDEIVVFRTNPTLTRSGNICIKTMVKGDTNCLPFEYNFGKNNK